MPRLFPLTTSVRSRMRETFVVWDLEDYSIPESLDLHLIKEKIKSAIKREGFFKRDVSICIYGGAEKTRLNELQDKFWEAGFQVCLYEGDKRARFNMIIGDLVIWAFKKNAEPSNLLILSENMEQDPKFCRFRQALENKGIFVASAHPETLINQETAFEKPDYSPIPYYQWASDGSYKIAYWHRGSSEAFRSSEVSCVSPAKDEDPAKAEDMERYRPSFSIGRTKLVDKS